MLGNERPDAATRSSSLTWGLSTVKQQPSATLSRKLQEKELHARSRSLDFGSLRWSYVPQCSPSTVSYATLRPGNSRIPDSLPTIDNACAIECPSSPESSRGQSLWSTSSRHFHYNSARSLSSAEDSPLSFSDRVGNRSERLHSWSAMASVEREIARGSLKKRTLSLVLTVDVPSNTASPRKKQEDMVAPAYEKEALGDVNFGKNSTSPFIKDLEVAAATSKAQVTNVEKPNVSSQEQEASIMESHHPQLSLEDHLRRERNDFEHSLSADNGRGEGLVRNGTAKSSKWWSSFLRMRQHEQVLLAEDRRKMGGAYREEHHDDDAISMLSIEFARARAERKRGRTPHVPTMGNMATVKEAGRPPSQLAVKSRRVSAKEQRGAAVKQSVWFLSCLREKCRMREG